MAVPYLFQMIGFFELTCTKREQKNGIVRRHLVSSEDIRVKVARTLLTFLM
jgi:hypothetical protein